MKPELIPFREWCKNNGFGLTTGYKLLNSGEVKAVKVGKLTFVTQEENKRWASQLPAYKTKMQIEQS